MAALDRWKLTITDACAVYALVAGREPPSALFARLRGDLLEIWGNEFERERLDIAALEAQWEAFTGRAFADAAKFADLYARLEPNLAREPGALAVTLLRPLDRERDERSHTRMLRSLLDPMICGPLGVKLLRAFLRVVRGGAVLDVPDEWLREATIEVEPAWSIGPKVVVPDLVVSVPGPDRRLVVVVENKVDARDHEGQLDSYREHVERSISDADVVLVYLTPNGDDPDAAESTDPWTLVSYWELLVAWRRVLALETESSAWTEMLRMYLATIFQGVFGFHLLPPPSRAVQARLVPYLQAALGE